MFTVEQIEQAHEKVKSGADFPNYIQEIKQLGVTSFETWVKDSHTKYFGKNDYHTKSKPQYEALTISEISDKEKFSGYLKTHQQGETDYYNGVKKGKNPDYLSFERERFTRFSLFQITNFLINSRPCDYRFRNRYFILPLKYQLRILKFSERHGTG